MNANSCQKWKTKQNKDWFYLFSTCFHSYNVKLLTHERINHQYSALKWPELDHSAETRDDVHPLHSSFSCSCLTLTFPPLCCCCVAFTVPSYTAMSVPLQSFWELTLWIFQQLRSGSGSEYRWSLLFWDSRCHGNTPRAGWISQIVFKKPAAGTDAVWDRLFTLTFRLNRKFWFIVLQNTECICPPSLFRSHWGAATLPPSPRMFPLCFLKHDRCVVSLSLLTSQLHFTSPLSSFLTSSLVSSRLIILLLAPVFMKLNLRSSLAPLPLPLGVFYALEVLLILSASKFTRRIFYIGVLDWYYHLWKMIPLEKKVTI